MENSLKHWCLIKETLVSYKIKFIAASGLALFLFFIIFNSHSQWITGPVINAILILTTVLAGPAEAAFTGLLPGFIAISNGILPPGQNTAIPVVMTGNIIFIITFHYIRSRGFIFAAISASMLKFLFIYIITNHLMQTCFNIRISEQVSVMMSWPQFVTAIAGCILAYVILDVLKKIGYGKKNNK